MVTVVSSASCAAENRDFLIGKASMKMMPEGLIWAMPHCM
ncbi:hypothetical protein CEV33_0718 [Brucella grignonensis]|uniref:Uncharacterized protein n=1 Tax=Brucella grignonensis TaxID=94627 RepID=A0A256FGF2_9HYPH|nr:hypothetical protein CEV33_0718 [Brucella grignonensis]